MGHFGGELSGVSGWEGRRLYSYSAVLYGLYVIGWNRMAMEVGGHTGGRSKYCRFASVLCVILCSAVSCMDGVLSCTVLHCTALYNTST